MVVLHVCGSYFFSLVNARFLVDDDSLLIGQFPNSFKDEAVVLVSSEKLLLSSSSAAVSSSSIR